MKLVGRAVELATLPAAGPAGGRSRVVIDVQGDECSDGCAAMRVRVEVCGGGVAADPGGLPVAPRADARAVVREPARTILASLRQDGPGPVSTLADCRRLVELMGGRLGALTDSDTGSFVWLAMKLPVDASRPRAWEPR